MPAAGPGYGRQPTRPPSLPGVRAEDPQVILIGGAPGVGKSTLGRAVAAVLGASSVTLDDVLIALRAVTTPESHPELHPMRSAGGHVPYFTEGSPELLIEDAIAQEEAVWPMIEAITAVYIARQAPLVLDWWLLPPTSVASLEDGVVSVWLHLDPEVLWQRERRNSDFLAGSTDPERMLAHFMNRSLWRNELVAVEAERMGLPLLRLDGSEHVDDLVKRVVALLSNSGL